MPLSITSKAALLAATCLVGVAALAQAPAPAAASNAPLARENPVQHDSKTQRIENIRVEDAGSRVDEVRAGGETKSITVQPKAGVPAYEVQPAGNTSTGANSGETAPGGAGRRVWKVLSF
ncbi:hypothetical protein [Ottowia thiooxydans]|uniref:hypothetical protein n=1 Tax=Ottowia thiooxydans TaxID=219182 RepID=UPI0004276646|nr:hypothetical protein [Ottowia thiooxydans]